MIDMKPKDAIKLEDVSLDKTYPGETGLPEDMLYRYIYINLEKHIEIKEEGLQTLSRVNIHID